MTRSLMQRRLGHDFANVRLHTDQRAAESAAVLGARAFTVGQDIVFGTGQFRPDTLEGRGVLAHELVHTVQESLPVSSEKPFSVSAPDDAAELEAHAVAHRSVVDGGRQTAGTATRTASICRLPFGISLPTGVRGLDPAELSILRPVFGSSLTYGDVYLSDAVGGGGRPFTTYVPILGTVINVGPAAYRAPGSNRSLLVHEATHSWQSQHHPSPVAFMGNSIASQAAATVAGGSAYCYVPGKPFAGYAAEQVAEQVENGEAAIVSHVRSVSAGAVDPANVIGLSIPRWETRGAPGVKC